MGRPISDESQYLTGYQYYRARPPLGPAAITRKLEQQFDDPPSEITVKRWCKKYAAIVEDDPSLDSPFEWHRLDDCYGLPWESSPYILRANRLHNNLVDIPATFRQARWWWRVHLAVPSLGLFDVWAVAEQFAMRELSHKLFADKLSVDDLEGWLAYQPWTDAQSLETYLADIDRLLIKPLRDPKVTLCLRDRLALAQNSQLGGSTYVAVALPVPQAPELLPSWLLKDELPPKRLQETSSKRKRTEKRRDHERK